MDGSKAKNVISVVKNPIGVIGLFLVLVEAIAALVVVKSSLSYSLNLILVLFIAVFPFAVLWAFYLLVTKHHEKLYSPSDYKDEKISLVHIIELHKPRRLLKFCSKRKLRQ